MNNISEKQNIIKDIGFSLLADGKTLRVRAEGYSMYPAIKPGSVVYLEPVTENDPPVPGEIIAWKRETGFVVHRLVRILKKDNTILFVTRGDSCRNEDKPVSPEVVAGKVSGIDDGKGKTITKDALVRKHCYFYNRLAVWVLIKVKRINRLL
jgi:signal peptidase I